MAEHQRNTIDYWEDELEKYRFVLTSVLNPSRYYDKFRSERVLDENDTQEIENPAVNNNRAKKAGHFLDTLRQRGYLAYKLLLDCLEADHPELFKTITGKEPEPKAWTYSLKRMCSCDCHDDRISLDLLEAYKNEKHQNVSLKQEVTKLSRSLDKVREERLKLRHDLETTTKQFNTCQSDAGEIQKLKDDIAWKKEQYYSLQAQAFETQTQLIAANDKLRKANLENNAMTNKVRELEARLSFHRKKSTRLEKARTESTEKMKEGDALRSVVEQLQIALERKKIEEARLSTQASSDELHDQTKLEIMIADKEEAVTKCEEAVKELHDVRQQLYDVQDAREKLEAENEVLETSSTLLKEELGMVTERLQMAQDELEQVSSERSVAFSESKRAFEEMGRSLVERDELVKKLNSERAAYLKQARLFFDCKNKLQRLRREVLGRDRPSSLASTDSGSCDSKRGSAAGEGMMPDGNQTSTTATMMTSQQHPDKTKRSTSHTEINKQASFDYADDPDEFADYEYPEPRERAQHVQAQHHGMARKASNASSIKDQEQARKMDGTSRGAPFDTSVSGEDSGITSSIEKDAPESPILETLPIGMNRVQDLWPGFDFVANVKDESGEKIILRKRPGLASCPPGVSTEVHSGSLKDKKRTPGPRISSCDYPASNYMADLKVYNRRSKTLGSLPDDPEFSVTEGKNSEPSK